MLPINIRCLSLITFCLYLTCAAERDFQFNDDLQVTLAEPQDETAKPVVIHPKNMYSKEISKCPYSESKIMLSLVVKSYDWKDIVDNKKNRVVNKLSKFFAVPKEYFKFESISRRDMHEMTKRSIKRGPNKCSTNRRLGKIEFVIGCGQSSYFTIADSIMNQIGEQMKDGSIDDITGIDFGWWIIWRKKISNRVQRSKRDAEGSGAEEIDEYDYGEDYDEDGSVTEIPTTPTHAHRHHHGVPKPEYTDSSITKISIDTNTIETNIKHKKNDLKPIMPTGESTIHTIVNNLDDEVVQKEVSKLESVITKTIENTEKLKDLPPVDVDTKKKNNNNNNKKSSLENSSSSKEEEYVNEDVVVMANSDSKTQIDSETTTTKSLPSLITTTATTISSTNEVTAMSTHIPYSTIISTNTISPSFDTATTLNSKSQSTVSSEIVESLPTEPTITVKTTITSTPVTTIITSDQKLINLEQSTLTSTVITTQLGKNHDESTTIVPLTDEVVLATNSNPSSRFIDHISTTTTATTTEFVNPTTSIIVDATEQTTQSSATTIYPSTSSTITPASSYPNRKDDGDEYNGTVETTREDETETSTVTNRLDSSIEPNSTETSTVITTPTTEKSTTSTTTTTTTTPVPTPEIIEPINSKPIIKNRIPKLPVTAGKAFTFTVLNETFTDNEDQTNLRLELLDKNGNELKPNSWIQYNPETREIYGLPLEDTVSRWQYKLVATDSGNESVTETLDISVQQYKGHRSVNHEFLVGVKFNSKFAKNIDWQLQLLHGITNTLNDLNTPSPIIVREIRQNQDPSFATFSYYNESLPKDTCPTTYQLNDIVEILRNNLNSSVRPDLLIKSVNYQLVGNCEKAHHVTTSVPVVPHITKNYSPVPRNQVDRVNATVGHLLVFKVPPDTFYDPEDTTDLKLSLLTMERNELNPRHWLQFDSKNQEFYGIPKAGDLGSEEYLLVAQDHEGLSATDALVVVVNHAPKREFSVYFKVKLGIRHEQFHAQMQKKFVERVAQLFGDPSPQYIQIRSITTNHDSDGTVINFYNTTLHRVHNRCPEEEIEMVRSVLFAHESNLRDRVRKIIGNEFELISVQMIPIPMGSCHSMSDLGGIHRDIIPIKTEDTNTSSTFKDDYLLTFVLPAVIILAMILLASIIACVLHRRRLTGKMELGDEEERKSFRSKGIPVIFQDELDEKPEIGNKSPIILKDEKPPLLPPSYNSTNIDGDNDCDEYVPPPAVIIGGREVRGKSPVTPSYRKPPPYVSP